MLTSTLSELTDKLKQFNQYNKILAVLDSSDYGEIVSTVYESLLRISTCLPRIKNPIPKREMASHLLRTDGNLAFIQKEYSHALKCYNSSALFAPVGSQSLAYAYSNRSALFAKIKKYSSALVDIDLCMNVKADIDHLVDKLEKRREECHASLWLEAVEHNNVMSDFNDHNMSEEFFQITGNHNPKFPFVKSCVDVVIKDGKEMVVTTSDLKVGEVVAVERPFVSNNLTHNMTVHCHYCSKYADNLIPCDTCAFALFCNQACKQTCWAEYHEIECNMIETYNLLPLWYANWFKFVIKTWRLTKGDMVNFTKVTKKMEGFLNGTEEAIRLDMNSIVSYLLPVDLDQIKRHGKLYDTALYTSLVIHGLNGIEEGILKAPCKEAFIHHVSIQLMFHVMHSREFSMSNATVPLGSLDPMGSNIESIGVLPFTSRVQHSCSPNLVAAGAGDRVALIVQKPVKAGQELTFAYGGDYLTDSYQDRQFCTFNLFGFFCTCRACAEDWPTLERSNTAVTDEYKHVTVKLQCAADFKSKWNIICDALNGRECKHDDSTYRLCYDAFKQLIHAFQYGASRQRLARNSSAI